MAFLELHQVSKNFGGLKAVSDIDFTVERNQIVGLIGPNGAGKTTIFNLISGFYKPSSGKIILDGKDITGLRPDKICKLGLTRTYQVVKPFNEISVLDNVIIGALNRTESVNVATEKANEVIDFLQMNNIRNQLAGSLPIALQKRLEIAKTLATEPQIILLDESMAGLRPSEIDGIIALILQIKERGIALVIVEHIMKIVMSLAEKVVVINYGQKIAEGLPEEVVHNPIVVQAYLGEKHAHASNK